MANRGPIFNAILALGRVLRDQDNPADMSYTARRLQIALAQLNKEIQYTYGDDKRVDFALGFDPSQQNSGPCEIELSGAGQRYRPMSGFLRINDDPTREADVSLGASEAYLGVNISRRSVRSEYAQRLGALASWQPVQHKLPTDMSRESAKAAYDSVFSGATP